MVLKTVQKFFDKHLGVILGVLLLLVSLGVIVSIILLVSRSGGLGRSGESGGFDTTGRRELNLPPCEERDLVDCGYVYGFLYRITGGFFNFFGECVDCDTKKRFDCNDLDGEFNPADGKCYDFLRDENGCKSGKEKFCIPKTSAGCNHPERCIDISSACESC